MPPDGRTRQTFITSVGSLPCAKYSHWPSGAQTGLCVCTPEAKNPGVSTAIRTASALVRSASHNGSPSPLVKYTRRLPSGDHEGAVEPWPRNGRGGPPVSGMSDFGAPASPACVNQTSPPSPVKPNALRIVGTLSGGRFLVRFTGAPPLTWLTQSASSPSRSATNATKLPSGEISAPPSVPSQSVKRENCALASGAPSTSDGRLTA